MLVAADSGNGVSAALDYTRFLFVNTELTVHLTRPAERVGLPRRRHARLARSASAWPRPCSSDERGRLGRSAQTLLVRERR